MLICGCVQLLSSAAWCWFSSTSEEALLLCCVLTLSSFFPTSKAAFHCFLWPGINAVTQSCRRSVCVYVCLWGHTPGSLSPVCLSTHICVWPSRFLKSEPHQNRPCGRAQRRMLMKLYTSHLSLTHTLTHSLKVYSAA